MATEAKHTAFTPGPWWTDGEYDASEMGCAIIAARTDCGPLPGNPTRGMVAWASAILEKDARQCEANARLIAAAPEMLEALKEGRRAIGDHSSPYDCYATGPLTGDPIRDLVQCPACSFIAMHDAALSKATGGQP